MRQILLIDDSTFQRNRVASVLVDHGYAVREARHGVEGLERLDEEPTDLILLDLLMPELDGFGVLDALRARASRVPVIVLTADIQETQKKRCLDLGARAFINKPPKPEVLLAIIEQVIEPEQTGACERLLTDSQQDALTEMINIGVGRAAAVLNAMLESHVVLQVPSLKVYRREELASRCSFSIGEQHVQVRLGFEGSLRGCVSLLFPLGNAAKLVSLLVNERDGDAELDSVRESTLTEVGNIVLNSVMGSIGNACPTPLRYRVPQYVRGGASLTMDIDPTLQFCVVANTVFTVREHEVQGEMILLFEVAAFRNLVTLLGDGC